MIEYDIWPWPPDLSVTPKEGRTSRPDVLAFAPAPEFVTFPETRAERVLVFGFAWSITRDATLAKQFWSEKGGRSEVFLMPSWQRDITPNTMPAAGSYTMTVNHSDYAGSYLTTVARDEVGRHIFVWDNANGLQVIRVLSAAPTTGSRSILTLEQPLAFTPNREAIVGFALLVRFDDDESEWQSTAPDKVKATLTFRTVRERIVTEADQTLQDGVEQYESLPFTSAVQTVEATPLRFNVSYALGPQNRGLAQNGTYAVLWAAWPSSGGVRLLRNATPDSITPPDETQGILSNLFTTALTTEHISLSWDQNSYEVIAWQSSPTEISIRRRFNNAPRTDTFTGFSPALFFNGQVNIQARLDGLTDVVCYYIRKGAAGIFARFQRDNFAIEYLLGGFPTRPLYLIGHEVDGLIHRFTAIDDGFRKMVLATTYPTQPTPPPDPYVALELFEAVGGEVALTDTTDEYAIIEPPPILEAAGAQASLPDTLSEDVAPPPTNFTEAPGASASIADIAYELVVISLSTAATDAAGALASINDVAYIFTAIESAALPEAVGASASIPDIYFGP